MRLITFDSQLHEAKFKLFLEKHIDKMWSKTEAPRCTKFSVCEKAEKIVQGFWSKHSELKKYVQ